jgi:hypothetical protein
LSLTTKALRAVEERVGEGTRTPDIQSHSLTAPEHNPLPANTSGTGTPPLAPVLAPGVEDTGLARVVKAWPHLPAPLRAAMLALVAAAAPGVAQEPRGGVEAANAPPPTTEAP